VDHGSPRSKAYSSARDEPAEVATRQSPIRLDNRQSTSTIANPSINNRQSAIRESAIFNRQPAMGPELYQPIAQRSFPFMAFVVRTDRDPYTVLPSIRRAIADLDPNMPLAGVKTMDEHIARALSRPRFLSTLVSATGW
jgi:hypothetical protein